MINRILLVGVVAYIFVSVSGHWGWAEFVPRWSRAWPITDDASCPTFGPQRTIDRFDTACLGHEPMMRPCFT